MRRKYKDIIKKSLAVVLAVTMLPLGDYSNVVMATEVNDTSVSSENKETDKNEYTDLEIKEDYNLKEDIEIGNLKQTSGTINLNGHIMKIHGDYISTGGELQIAGGSVYCSGQINLGRYSYIKMNDVNDYMFADSGISILSAYSENQITNGVIETKGELNITSQVVSRSGYNKILLSGDGLQKVDIAQGIYVNILELDNHSNDGVDFIRPVNHVNIIRNDTKITIDGKEGIYGHTLTDDEVIEGDCILIEDTMKLDGHSLTINGNLIQMGGTMDIGNGELTVNGDYRLQFVKYDGETETYGVSSGRLKMLDDAGIVNINGDFISQTSVKDENILTAGVMRITGDVSVNSTVSVNSFMPTENHTIVLCGTDKQVVNFDRFYTGSSHIQNLEILNASEAGVEFGEKTLVTGNVKDNGYFVKGYLVPSSDTTYTDDAYHGNWYIYSSLIISNEKNFHIYGDIYSKGVLNLQGKLTVEGNYEINYGRLEIVGGVLEISGNFTTDTSSGSGYHEALFMNDNNSRMVVNGNFKMDKQSYASTLSAGVLEVKGDFSAFRFTAGKGHKLLLSGDTLQTVTLDEYSYLGTLELNNNSADGVYSEKAIVKNELKRNGCRLRYGDTKGEFGWELTEDYTYDGDLILIDEELNLNGHKLTVMGNLIQPAGKININGGELIVKGDYHMENGKLKEDTAGEEKYEYSTGAGMLCMTNPEDKVLIEGDFVNNTPVDHKGYMTAGTITVNGDFTIKKVTGNQTNGFYSTGAHTVILDGKNNQKIVWEYEEIYNSRIANIIFSKDDDNNDRKIIISGNPYVTENVNDGGCIVTGKICPAETLKFENNRFNGGLNIRNEIVIDKELYIGGDIYNEGSGHIVMNGGKLTVNGNYDMPYSWYTYGVDMTHDEDYVKICGNFNYSPYYSTTMSAGTLEVQGDFTVLRGLNGCKNHKVILSGNNKQSVNINKDSSIGTLELLNKSDDGIYAETIINKQKLIRNGCKISYKDLEGEYGWTLEDDELYEGDLVIIDDSLNLNGHKLTVTGDIVHIGGNIEINGGQLICKGNYRQQARVMQNGEYVYTQGSSILCMNNEDDRVVVYGDYITESIAQQNGYMTDGTLEVYGNIETVGEAKTSFCASDKHTLKLKGEKKQKISFNHSGYQYSKISNLIIDNPEGIEIDDSVYVSGNIHDISKNVKGNIEIGDNTVFENETFSGGIAVKSGVKYSKNIRIQGGLYLSGVLTLSGKIEVNGDINAESYSGITMDNGQLTTNGNFNMSGWVSSGIVMSNAEDYIKIAGDFNYSPYWDGTFSNGILEIGGNFNAGAFYGRDNHKVILSGTKLQTITFDNINSYFNVIELKNHSDEGIYSDKVFKKKKLIKNGCRIRYGETETVSGYTLTEDYTCEGDFILTDGILDLNGYKLTVNGDFIHADGELNINGGVLAVSGDYRLQTRSKKDDEYEYSPGLGKLKMQKDADGKMGKISTGGDFIFEPDSNINDCIIAGDIEVKGDFTQKGYYGFNGGDDIGIKFSGDNTQTVISHMAINAGTLINDSKDLDVQGEIKLSKTITDNGKNITGAGSVTVNSLSCINENEWSGNVKTTDKSTDEEVEELVSDYTIGGTLSIGEGHRLKLNGHTLRTGGIKLLGEINADNGAVLCSGDMAIGRTGKLIMLNADDYVLSNGNFTFVTYYNHNGLLTDGLLEVRGAFNQGSYRNFIATQNHATKLSSKKSKSGRAYIQSVKFGYDAGITRFHKLILTKPDNEYQFLNSVETISDEIIYNIEDTEAPTSVTVLEKEMSDVTSVKIRYSGASDNTGISGYEIYRNNVRVGVTASEEYTDRGLLPDTEYVYKVYAFDVNRNTASTSPELKIKTEADTEAPEKVKALYVVNKTGSSVTIGWYPAKDNVKTKGYRVYRNGKIIAEDVLTNKYKDTSVEAGTSYKYEIEAYDAEGNTSEISDKLEASTAVPEITNISPADNQIVGGNNVVLNVRFSNWGNSTGNKVKIEYRTKDKEWEMLAPTFIGQSRYNDNELQASYTWDISNISESGDFDVKYTLYDADGNTVQKQVTYTIDKDAPELPKNITARDDNGTVIVKWKPSVSADCCTYTLYRADENGKYNKIAEFNDRYASSYTDKNVNADTEYKYKLRVSDRFGNISDYSEEISVTAGRDTKNPVVNDITPDSKRINGHTSLTIKATDNREVEYITIEISKDKENYSELAKVKAESGKASYIWNTTKYEDGTYFLRIKATDTSGNTSEEDFVKKYEIDNTGISKIKVEDVTALSTAVQIKWEDVSEEDFSYFQIEMLEDDRFIKVGTISDKLGYNILNLMPDTSYTFRVVGYDNLGNAGVPSDNIEIKTAQDNVSPVITQISPAPSEFNSKIALEACVQDNYSIDYAVFSYSYDKINYTEIARVYSDTKGKNEKFNCEFDVSSLNEGKIYVKFDAYDSAGNKNILSDNGAETVAEYTIDRTSPDIPEKPYVVSDCGNVKMTWNAVESEDTGEYNIYRADMETGIYKLVEKGYSATTYTDVTAEPGKSYSYKISVSDKAGNESEYSTEMVVTTTQDTEAPIIKSVSPENGSIVGKNPELKVLAIDNTGRITIKMQYRPAGNEEWIDISENYSDGVSNLMETTWKTEGIDDGDYEYRVLAQDGYGNVSDIVYGKYTLNSKKPSKPVFNVKSDYKKIVINIEKSDNKVDHYNIYRRVENGSYSKTAIITKNQYCDTRVKSNTIYYYKVTAVDDYGNESDADEKEGYVYGQGISLPSNISPYVDTEPPVAIVTPSIMGIAEMEVAFDGTASTDNVEVTEYNWDMGDGTVYKDAPHPIHVYQEPGIYTAVLEVKDAAGNSDSATITVEILENNGNGIAEFNIMDQEGNLLPHADVYVKNSENEIITMKADYLGKVVYAGKTGPYIIAAYKEGYDPKEYDFHIDEYQKLEYNVVLQKKDVVTGNLTVKRLTLDEIMEAGIDLNNPDNINSFKFDFTLKLEKTNIPEEKTHVGGEGSSSKIKDPDPDKSSGGSESKPDGLGSTEIKVVKGENNDKPVIAVMTTTQGISWLKEMFDVQLEIINSAASKFYISEGIAEINLQNGLSVAKGEETVEIDDIYGGQKACASWIIRGDKRGSYYVSADFTGKMMPFNSDVSVSFMSSQTIDINGGKGIRLTLMPEKSAYIDDTYYIQVKIENLSGMKYYNFDTTIPPFVSVPGKKYYIDKATGKKICITDANTAVLPKNAAKNYTYMSSGGKVRFAEFNPGDCYYGTITIPFSGEGDPEKEYYKLIEAIYKIIEGEDLGIEIVIDPIDSHTEAVRTGDDGDSGGEQPKAAGDPVDLSSGSYTEDKEYLPTLGGTALSFEMKYDSRINSSGELGVGWRHTYEQHMELKDGVIKYYTNPYSYAYFVPDDSLQGNVKVRVAGDTIIPDTEESGEPVKYTCLNKDMTDYKITLNPDGTYTLNAPGGDVITFDNQGRLSQLTDRTGKTVGITYTASGRIITDGISGKSIEIICSQDGKITELKSDNRTVSFAYDGDKLVNITDAEENITSYTYTADNRIESVTDGKGVTYVYNVYDSDGRVTEQTNALGGIMSIRYDEHGTGTKVTVTDENNNVKYMYVDEYERVTKVVNENGGVTQYGYDDDGNLIYEGESGDGSSSKIIREYDDHGNMTSYTDTGNLTTKMKYDSDGNLISITNAENNNSSYAYDNKNQKIYEKDYAGKITRYTYDESGMLSSQDVENLGSVKYTYTCGLKTSETDAMGNTTLYEYDYAGNMIKITAPDGGVSEFVYDKNGKKISETNAAGATVKYEYDCNGNVISKTDKSGNITSYTYDAAGNMTCEKYPDGTCTRYTYDVMGHMTDKTEPGNIKTVYTYDESGNVISETYADGSIVSYTYDHLNQRTSECDVNGNIIKYEYYPNGNIGTETTTDSNGKVLDKKVYTYNNAWKKISVNHNGTAVSYTYDSMGNVTSETNPVGTAVKYTYDIYGRMTSETDARGNTTYYTYDANNNCTEKTDAMGNTVYMRYDSMNRMVEAYRMVGTEKYSVSYEYNNMGQVTRTVDEEGNAKAVTYDGDGNILTMTDTMGNIIKENTYDSMNRTSEVKDALGNITSYKYDEAGRLKDTIMYLNTQSQRTYSYGYDSLGRNNKVTDPSDGTTSCTYDSRGNMETMTDAMGGTWKYSYDGAGRVTCEINAIGNRTEYTYNDRGLLEKLKDGENRNTEYTYDDAGRVTAMKDSLGSVTYTYDENGNVLTVKDSTGTVERKYDELNRVVWYKNVSGNIIQYEYDALGNLIKEVYPDKSSVKYTYYKNGYLHTVTDRNGRKTSYTYNGNGCVTGIALPDGTVETDSYDKAGRLIKQETKKAAEVISSYVYEYDTAGNLAVSHGMETTGAGQIQSAEMTYDSQNRLLTYNGEKVKYDNCGNMIYGPLDGKMVQYTYDCRNRLTKAGNTNYGYDGENVRLYAETVKNQVASREEYVTDTVSSKYPNVIMIIRNDSPDTVLTYGNGLISEETDKETYYHHYNNIGSTMYLTDSEGNICAEYIYGTYGELLKGDTNLTSYLYNGKYGVMTDENGLYYMRHRYYNTDIRRFVNQDIVNGNLGNSQSLNRYSYVQGNPLTYTDPFGLSPEKDGGSIGMNIVHGLLDALGCVPGGVGIVANFANAALYAVVDHDYGMAALSLVAGVTLGASKIVSMGGKLAGHAKSIETIGKLVSNTASFAICAEQTVSSSAAMWNKYHEKGAKLSGETALEILGIGLNVAGMAASGKGIVESGNRLGKMVKEGGTTNKMSKGISESGSNTKATFASEEKLLSHFDKHGGEFKGIFNTADEYLQGAQDVMQNGYKVEYAYKGEIRTGYVQFMGNNSKSNAKFAFVGTNNEGYITTFHTESGKSFWKMLNGENTPVINPK